MTLYKIANWEKFYEVSDSKKVDGPLQWVAVRTKTDGLGFLRITLQPDRTDLLAAWYLLLGLAAKQPKGERGKLSRDGVPLTPDDMELLTRFPAKLFSKALTFFSDAKQGWLESEDIRTDPDASGQNPNPLGQTPPTGQDITGQNNKEAASPTPLPFSSDAFKAAWQLFQKHRAEIRKPLKPTSAQMALKQLGAMGEQRAIRCIEHTIAKGWQGLREPDANTPAIATARPAQPAYNEPNGWKAYLNHTYPDSVYSAGGGNEAHNWADLPRDIQGKIAGEMARERRAG